MTTISTLTDSVAPAAPPTLALDSTPTPARVAAALALYAQLLEQRAAGAVLAVVPLADADALTAEPAQALRTFTRCRKCGQWSRHALRVGAPPDESEPAPPPPPTPDNRLGFELEAAGEALLLQGRTDDARPYFARAYSELSKDAQLIADEPDRLARLKALGFGRY